MGVCSLLFDDLRKFAVKIRLFLPFRVGETLSGETNSFLTHSPTVSMRLSALPFQWLW